jgi:CheY-like chemotaxis protein
MLFLDDLSGSTPIGGSTALRNTRRTAAYRQRRIRSTARILVVDDDECVRELLRLHLKRSGYEVEVARDAIDAGHRLVSRVPDLAIVDAEMPYMDGLEFVASLAAERRLCEIPVVFLATRDDQIGRAEQLGAVACLSKPLPVRPLLQTVAWFASRQQAV